MSNDRKLHNLRLSKLAITGILWSSLFDFHLTDFSQDFTSLLSAVWVRTVSETMHRLREFLVIVNRNVYANTIHYRSCSDKSVLCFLRSDKLSCQGARGGVTSRHVTSQMALSLPWGWNLPISWWILKNHENIFSKKKKIGAASLNLTSPLLLLRR